VYIAATALERDRCDVAEYYVNRYYERKTHSEYLVARCTLTDYKITVSNIIK